MENKLRKYVGNFEFYYETGMEQMGCIFHDDRGLHKIPSYNEETRSYDGPEHEFKSLNWAIWLGHNLGQYKTRIFNEDGSVLYEGPISRSIKKMKTAKWQFSFIPNEIRKNTWLRICKNELRAELYTNELTLAEKQIYKITYDIGTPVLDELTGEHAVVINVTLGKDNAIGYWINSDYCGGRRHPWELSSIKISL